MRCNKITKKVILFRPWYRHFKLAGRLSEKVYIGNICQLLRFLSFFFLPVIDSQGHQHTINWLKHNKLNIMLVTSSRSLQIWERKQKNADATLIYWHHKPTITSVIVSTVIIIYVAILETATDRNTQYRGYYWVHRGIWNRS